MSFPFSCPRCKSSWKLNKKEITNISKGLPLICRECGNNFVLLDGVTEIITTDNIFLQYMLRSNHVILGKSEVIPGELEVVDLKSRFKEIHHVFLTPTGSQPIRCEPVIIGDSKFLIVSSLVKSSRFPRKIQVLWSVYGNKHGLETPLWRQLLANAKGYEINKDFRMEIVELETAFEVFLYEYLKPKLKTMCTDQIMEMIFQHFRRMEDITNFVFKIPTGKTLRGMLKEANRDKLYGIWKECVKDQRDKILHKGEGVTNSQAKKAFEAVFKIIVFLEPKSLEYLQTSLEEHESLFS